MKKLLALIIKDITFNLRIFSITFIGFTALIFINTSKYGDGGNNIVNYLFFCGAASLVAAPISFAIDDDKSTRSFLSGIPVSQVLIIIAKYILAIMASLIFSSLVASIYMFAFYKWDRNVATFASMAVAFLPALIPKEIDDVVIDRNQITLALVITIFIISLVVSTLLSIINTKVILKRR